MRIFKTILISAALFCATAVPSFALSSHTWVGPNGNDSNAGTQTSPYATFQNAMENTAPGGTVSVLGAGDYGYFQVSNSITIDGTGGGSINFPNIEAGIAIEPSTNAVVILKNLTITGAGAGGDAIGIVNGGTTNLVTVVIDGCLITGFMFNGIEVFNGGPVSLTVKNSTIVGGETGVSAEQNGQISLDHVTIQGASIAGVYAEDGNLQVTNSVITQNAIGLKADTYAVLSAANNVITSNQVGVCSGTGSKIRLDTNDIYDNPIAIKNCGGIYKTSASNRTSGTISATAAQVSETVIF